MINALVELLKTIDQEMDESDQEAKIARHIKALNWEMTDRLPLILTYPFPKSSTIQPFPHSEALQNPEKMLFNELVYAFETSIWLNNQIKDDLVYTIRANYGTVIIASLYTGRIEQRDDNPPWVRHYDTSDERLEIFQRDPFDYSTGYVKKLIETYIFYNQVFNDFPNLKKSVRIVLPDLQGPLDTLELLWGSDIYSDLILKPELVEKGMKLLADSQVRLADFLKQYINDGPLNFSHQHATTIKGNILIRNDSAIMISPEMYRNQVAHHDEFILNNLKGGGIHSCGSIDFNIHEIFNLGSIECFDFGQSHMNDLDKIYQLAANRKIALIRLMVTKEELLSGKIQKRFPTGVSLVYQAGSLEEAKYVSSVYFRK